MDGWMDRTGQFDMAIPFAQPWSAILGGQPGKTTRLQGRWFKPPTAISTKLVPRHPAGRAGEVIPDNNCFVTLSSGHGLAEASAGNSKAISST